MTDFKKILIVDDSITILEIVKKFITNKSYEIITANNGASGLKIAQTEKPDVILLDVMLPKMDGYTVCMNIKQDPSLAKTKIILFSVKSDAHSITLGKAAGADEYIPKDAGLENISALIEKLLKQS